MENNNGEGIIYSVLKNASRENEERNISIKDKMTSIAIAIIVAVAFDYLFYGRALGLSYPIFITMLLGFFIYNSNDKINYKSKFGWFLLAAILLLSMTYAIYSSIFLGFINFITVPILICIYTIVVTDSKIDWSKPGFLVILLQRIFVQAFSCIPKPFRYIKEAAIRRGVSKGNNTRNSILLGLLISLPILLIIIPLLASADMAFNYYIKNISNLLSRFNIGDLPVHILIIFCIFLYIFGYAWSFKYKNEHDPYLFNEIKVKIDPAIINTMLTVVNLIYLLFTLMQLSYLYGGSGNTLPQGLTYAEYARRGFFELVFVAIINFIILILSLKLARQDSKGKKTATSICLSFLVIFTINMLFSANYRMNLYEESFGFTLLRIYVHMFMLLMLILLVIALVRIWYDRLSLFKASFISSILMLIVLNYMNAERLVARNNINRYFDTGKIDVQYLLSLSNDGLPEVIQLLNDKHIPLSPEGKEYIMAKKRLLDRDYDWMEYNLSRENAKAVLKNFSND